MLDKKTVTTIRWTISLILLPIALGLFIYMLVSGIELSLDYIVIFIGILIFVGFAIWMTVVKKKSSRQTANKKFQASELFSQKKYTEAIRIWKELLLLLGEDDIKEILLKLKGFYQEIQSNDGLEQLSKLEKMFNDLFQMNRMIRLEKKKQLDAKGRVIRESLISQIREEVAKLPE
jgi:hypothetical protein